MIEAGFPFLFYFREFICAEFLPMKTRLACHIFDKVYFPLNIAKNVLFFRKWLIRRLFADIHIMTMLFPDVYINVMNS